MEFRGYVDKGWIKPTEPITLPEGTPVTFMRASTRTSKASPRRVEKSKPVQKWKSRPLRSLVKEQGTTPLKSLGQLAGDWPDDESIDEFLKSVRKGRK